ncbi:MAG: hypothetical protein FWC32_10045 [Firmicutes bacterium]|nr:hypothetical protein [Bacillota bacterium]
MMLDKENVTNIKLMWDCMYLLKSHQDNEADARGECETLTRQKRLYLNLPGGKSQMSLRFTRK